MLSYQSSYATSMILAPTISEDFTYTHRCIVSRVRYSTKCVYCNKIIRDDGITRLKYHLTEILDDIEVCKKVPNNIN